MESETKKRCSTCLFHKSTNDFYSDKSKKDKLSNQCRACVKKRERAKVECECGKSIFKQDLQKHITRPIHFKWLNFKLSQEVN